MTAQPQTSAASLEAAASGAAGFAGDMRTDAAHLTQFISFSIGEDQYGVDIMSVREIRGWSEIAYIPKQPEYVRGVLNLRGVIVPIIDLRCRFGQGLTEATPLHIVIIVQTGGRQVGLLADRVLDIVSIEGAKIQPVPRVTAAARADFLAGLVTTASGLIALIDLSHLFSGVEQASDCSAERGDA